MQKKIFITTALLFLFCELSIGQGTWIQKSNYPGLATIDAVGLSINGKGYIAGAGPAFWEWDPSADLWTQRANFPYPGVVGRVAFSIGNKGYIGASNTDSLDIWEWDQSTNVWTQKAGIVAPVGALTARLYSVGFSIGNKGYIGTGTDGNSTYYQDFWEWDQSTNVWTQKTDFGGLAKYLAVGFSIGTKGYLGVGSVNQDFWEWDQSTDAWTQKANFAGGNRGEAVGFSIGNYGYIGTGTPLVGNRSSVSDFWRYDVVNNIWTQVADFGGGVRELAIGFSIGCKGYVGMGYRNDTMGTQTNDFWEYTPDTCSSVGILVYQNQSAISFSPNPFNLQTILNTNRVLKNASLTVYNSIGERVKQVKNISGQTIIFHRDNLPIGIYYVWLTQENKIIATDRIIVTD